MVIEGLKKKGKQAFPLKVVTGLVSEYNLYFLNGSHFSEFLYLALLITWLNLEPLYLAELYIYTGATHREEI